MSQAGKIISLRSAVEDYLAGVTEARSARTAATYGYAMKAFLETLDSHGVDPDEMPVEDLDENAVGWFAAALKAYTPATEQLYLTAANGFYQYLAAEGLGSPNLPRVQMLIHKRSRRTGQRLPQFPREDIEKVLEFVKNLPALPADGEGEPARNERLRSLRDRAFLITLADTGLRVHEACELRRGDLDWNEGRAVIIGKGDKQAVVRFSGRAMIALKDYLAARAALDGASGRPLPSLPLFARHDRGAGRKIKPITTVTGRNIVAERAAQALGQEASAAITPHSFRHYFVTTVLRSSGNLKLAQELARHKNIAITQRYAHLSDDELDEGYWNVFEEH